jgi:hypothetical protein
MFEGIRKCPDCGVAPGTPHEDGCDVEICSACTSQRLQCACPTHDKQFAMWRGIWPGQAEAECLGITLNQLRGPLRELVFKKAPRVTVSVKFIEETLLPALRLEAKEWCEGMGLTYPKCERQ